MNTNQRLITWVLLIALIAISVFNLFYLESKRSEEDGRLNSKVEAIKSELKEQIKSEIKNITIPEPQNNVIIQHGKNGANGTSGTNGANGSNGTSGLAGANGVDGKDGKDGEQGAPGREVELRVNPKNGNLEWRYVGELSWTRLLKKCDIQGNCP